MMPNIIVQKRKKTAVDPLAAIGIMIIIPLQKRAWGGVVRYLDTGS